MLTNSQILFLQGIKKAAVVLFLLAWLERPVRVAELSRLLQISENSARRHLHALRDLGLLICTDHSSGYVLSERARNLFFCPEDLKKCGGVSIINGLIKDQDNIQTIIINDEVKKCASDSKNYAPVDKTVDKSIGEEQEPALEMEPALKQALCAAGIMINRRTRKLAELAHVTPAFVRAHHLGLLQKGLGSQTGILIRMLEDGLPAPELQENDHLKDCQCEDCQRRGYQDWETSGRD